ncbi:MAG TPA: DNA alkylation repair protein [Streptosporangiaceae bacterium]
MNIDVAVTTVESELRALADPVRSEGEKRYLKSDFVHIGGGLPAIRGVATAALRESNPDRTSMLAFTKALWTASDNGTPIHDMRMVAIEVLIHARGLLRPEDLAFAERLIRDSKSWAYVDALAVKVVGDLVLRYPDLAAELDRYVHDDNFWIRRTALLALLPGIRADDGDLVRLSGYGDLLIGEREFFIRKALGWVLRELSKRDPGWVTTWVTPRISRISGVTLREAVRHLPVATRDDLLASYKSR